MIVGFAAHKGGVGKTTSSINLSAGLARRGKSTLLIDMDPQGHSSIGLGVEAGYDDPCVADLLSEHPLGLRKVIHPTDISGLAIAPGNLRLAAAAESLATKFKREERLAKSLTAVRDAYDWIIIDCPPALGVLTANAVAASDLIIVPVSIAARALDGLEDLLDMVRIVKGEDFACWRILVTMFDPRKTVTLEIFSELLTPYAANVLATRIHVSESLNQAQLARRDIFAFDPRGRGAANYDELAQELLRMTR